MHDDELTPQEQFYAENPERTVPRDLARGRNRQEIIADVVRLGWTAENAAALVDRAAADLDRYRSSPQGRREVLMGAVREFFAGLILVLLGVCLAVTTVLLAIAGWVLVLPYGLICLGIALSVRGYTRWSTYRGNDLTSRSDGHFP
jgi:hypothetical protein